MSHRVGDAFAECHEVVDERLSESGSGDFYPIKKLGFGEGLKINNGISNARTNSGGMLFGTEDPKWNILYGEITVFRHI